MHLGKIEEDKIKEIEIMEKIKEKSIDLLLGIISKEDFEMILYEKVKSEDLIKNKLLFDLVNINYRNDNFKVYLLELIQENFPEETIIILKIHHYSTLIKDEDNYDKIYKNFYQIYKLIDFDKDYQLLWDFYEIQTRLDLVGINYEKEENVISSLKTLCNRVCIEFKSLKELKDKINFLVYGLKEEEKVVLVQENQVKTKIINSKKWYQFWK